MMIMDRPPPCCGVAWAITGESGKLIFPRKSYLRPREYSNSYFTDVELIIISRTLRNLGIEDFYNSRKEFVRLFSFKEINPIICEFELNSDSIKYAITNGFSWTHGQLIKQSKLPVKPKDNEKIRKKLEQFIKNDQKIFRNGTISDFVIEFKVNETYAIIRLSRFDYNIKENKEVMDFIKLFEKLMKIKLIE